MLDQLYGRPSSSWKRSQVFIVLLFWLTAIRRGPRTGPRLLFIRRINKFLARFTPWQIVVSTLLGLYAVKNSDAVLGLQAPEPLARLYSRNYYRATWIVTALDAGFATAMTIRPKWIRDIFSVLFSGYYLIFANEADEKLRKYRAMCTVEMLRATWEKTSNPYLRFISRSDRPTIPIHRNFLLSRPPGSRYSKPITAWIFFDGTELELSRQTDLIFDLPGGGFICMTPEHHEERLLRWAISTKKPIISFDYGKAPEYPFPYAIDEAFDAYKKLVESKGKEIGMSGENLTVVMTGDSAGANIATALVIKILETTPRLPLPCGLVFAYAALSFHFTSWMPASDLRVLRQDSSSNVAGLLAGKAHLEHRSPLSVVEDVPERSPFRRRRTSSWGRSFVSTGEAEEGDDERELDEQDKPLSDRVVCWDAIEEEGQKKLQGIKDKVAKRVLATALKGAGETRLAMTSRTAFFNDRIISPSMCRAMALLYIGPRNAPDLHSDYHISPIFTPPSLLAQFPPVYLSCGERDPFVDDTVIFAGKIREAKETRKLEIQAKATRFGEGLRMSSGGPKRDPILDENEEDWVQMRILKGWSHGYLQMSALLPEAVSAIEFMAEWIEAAFDKHHSIATSAVTAPAKSHSLPTASNPVLPLPSPALDEDEPLSFTPKRRNSRATSPTVISPAPSLPHVATTATSSSDESVFGPRTPSPNSIAGALSAPSTEPVRRFTEPGKKPPFVNAHSDELMVPPGDKARRGSGGTHTPHFIDTKELLLRRRKDVVFGISQNSSAVQSEDEDESVRIAGAGGGAVVGKGVETGAAEGARLSKLSEQ